MVEQQFVLVLVVIAMISLSLELMVLQTLMMDNLIVLSGFSLKYMGSRRPNANSFSLFSDNQQAGTQVEAVTVFQDGIVGINSTIPSERLDVGGTTN